MEKKEVIFMPCGKKISYKYISRQKYNAMKKLGYISKGRDGVVRGLFLTKRGTTSVPIKIRKSRVK